MHTDDWHENYATRTIFRSEKFINIMNNFYGLFSLSIVAAVQTSINHLHFITIPLMETISSFCDINEQLRNASMRFILIFFSLTLIA